MLRFWIAFINQAMEHWSKPDIVIINRELLAVRLDSHP